MQKLERDYFRFHCCYRRLNWVQHLFDFVCFGWFNVEPSRNFMSFCSRWFRKEFSDLLLSDFLMASSDLKADSDVVNCANHLNLTVHRMRRIFCTWWQGIFSLNFALLQMQTKKTFIVMQMWRDFEFSHDKKKDRLLF